MKKLILIIALLTITGCASRGAVSNLEAQVDILAKVVGTTVNTANDANIKSDKALNTANRALIQSNVINNKMDTMYQENTLRMDNMFEKSQYK